MILFLLWQARQDSPFPEPERVRARFAEYLAPLFAERLEVRLRSDAATHLVYAALPVGRWKPAPVQEDAGRTVFAANYPVDAYRVLGLSGPAALGPLPELARGLETTPAPLLERLAPPFLLLWSDGAATRLQNDGLGHAQCFAWEGGGHHAWGNRLFGFRALGIDLVPVAEDWAAKASFGWFPLETTGFRGFRYLAPGTRMRIDAREVREERFPALERWSAPGLSSNADCLALARQSLIDYIRATERLYEEAHGGLTGGYDSRALFATYRHLGLPLRARVKGPENNHDVVLARRLAETAGLRLKVKNAVELPPPDAGALRASIEKALLWQAGQVVNHKHKTFLARGGGLAFGDVNVMGHDGPIGRSVFQQDMENEGFAAAAPEDWARAWLLRKLPGGLRPAMERRLRDTVEEILARARRFPLIPERHQDFVYLVERSRRWGSGTQSSQTDLVLAPFLNADFIRAALGYRGDGPKDNVFHRDIVARHAPDWADIPYELDLRFQEQQAKGRNVREEPELDRPWTESNGHHYYNRPAYWRQVGRPLVEEILAEPGLWSEVFEPARAREEWPRWGDELAMLGLIERLTG